MESLGAPKKEQKLEVNREIETLLMIHEKKSSATIPAIPGAVDAEGSDSSDSEAETSKPAMQSDGEGKTYCGAVCLFMICLFMFYFVYI